MYVRFWLLADISPPLSDVRSTLRSGHSSGRTRLPQMTLFGLYALINERPLTGQSGHRPEHADLSDMTADQDPVGLRVATSAVKKAFRAVPLP